MQGHHFRFVLVAAGLSRQARDLSASQTRVDLFKMLKRLVMKAEEEGWHLQVLMHSRSPVLDGDNF